MAPRLLTPVQVPFPDMVGGFVDLKVRITLFIDEQGTVRRVRIDSPDVPPLFEQTIRDTFAQARFKPGELRTPPSGRRCGSRSSSAQPAAAAAERPSVHFLAQGLPLIS
ncbi:hypothetical protein HK414_03240 [Ramlibacter terrae]|uniref:TonB C-terminal domain-containing protein n=1 Tax=Ramlibacter terrae TaxID=2732511 RepID=A0ABX6P3F1_9BURK|nr:hypothetical protein HK414_03240 [Ramlibacter terrae]